MINIFHFLRLGIVLIIALVISVGCTFGAEPRSESIPLAVTPDSDTLENQQTIIISVIPKEWKDAKLVWSISSNDLKSIGELSSSTDSTIVYRAPSQGQGKVEITVNGVTDSITGSAKVSFTIISKSSSFKQASLNELQSFLNKPGSTKSSLPLMLVFAYGNVGDSDLRIADVENSVIRPVAGQVCDEAEPSWSPDSVYIIYHAKCAESYDIYRVKTNGGATIRLTATSDIDEREPDYSPDGSLIVYRSNPSKTTMTNDDGELWLMDANGSNSRSLGVIGRAPLWSPDGKRIAYMSRSSGRWNIYIYDQATKHIAQLTNCPTNCRWPAWSPDGRMIIYNTTTKPDNTVADALWIISANGGKATRITSGINAGRPSWSRSGLIAFSSDNGIEYIHEDGGGRTVLIPGNENWAPYWSR